MTPTTTWQRSSSIPRASSARSVFAIAQLLIPAGLVCTAALLISCGPEEPACYGDVQCPEDQYCTARGVCAAVDTWEQQDGGLDAGSLDLADADVQGDGAAPADAGVGVDSALPDGAQPDSSARPDAGSPDLAVHVCADWDGVITAEELPFGPNLRAYYRNIDPDDPQPVDLTPAQTADGPRWDFSAAAEGEQSVVNETFSLDGAWFADDFPDATYTALLEDGGDVLGVMRVSEDQLEMIGAVSVDEGRVNLTYDPPVVLFEYPFTVGDSWSTEALVSGTFEWIYTTYFEDYVFTVTQEGRALVPAGVFPVLEVKAEHESRVYAPFPITTTQIKYSYVSECYGAVATVGSRFDEEEDPFSLAREYKRLGF